MRRPATRLTTYDARGEQMDLLDSATAPPVIAVLGLDPISARLGELRDAPAPQLVMAEWAIAAGRDRVVGPASRVVVWRAQGGLGWPARSQGQVPGDMGRP
jgi:hypothetical protein